MSATLIAPEYELFPNRYRWAVAECYRLAEEGRLPGRFEILDGEVVNKMGQGPLHRIATNNISTWLGTVFGPTLVQSPGPISLMDAVGSYI